MSKVLYYVQLPISVASPDNGLQIKIYIRYVEKVTRFSRCSTAYYSGNPNPSEWLLVSDQQSTLLGFSQKHKYSS